MLQEGKALAELQTCPSFSSAPNQTPAIGSRGMWGTCTSSFGPRLPLPPCLHNPLLVLLLWWL